MLLNLIFLSGLVLNFQPEAWALRGKLDQKYHVIPNEKTFSVRAELQTLKNIFTVYSQYIITLLSRLCWSGKQSCTVKKKSIKLVSLVQCPAKKISIHPQKNKSHVGKTKKKALQAKTEASQAVSLRISVAIGSHITCTYGTQGTFSPF